MFIVYIHSISYYKTSNGDSSLFVVFLQHKLLSTHISGYKAFTLLYYQSKYICNQKLSKMYRVLRICVSYVADKTLYCSFLYNPIHSVLSVSFYIFTQLVSRKRTETTTKQKLSNDYVSWISNLFSLYS